MTADCLTLKFKISLRCTAYGDPTYSHSSVICTGTRYFS